jgi:hypothetical protein
MDFGRMPTTALRMSMVTLRATVGLRSLGRTSGIHLRV